MSATYRRLRRLFFPLPPHKRGCACPVWQSCALPSGQFANRELLFLRTTEKVSPSSVVSSGERKKNTSPTLKTMFPSPKPAAWTLKPLPSR